MALETFYETINTGMPKKIPNKEFEAVVTVVAAHPGGVKIDAIRKGLDITLPDRMLQRRLSRLPFATIRV